MTHKQLTQERLREVLHYDPETGAFTWLVATAMRVRSRVGQSAGTINDEGYVRIQIDGKKHRAHRLAWLYMTGVWPESGVDHKFGNRSDNRWAFLREANQSLNTQNERGPRRNNKSGFLGVCKHGAGYRAQIWLPERRMVRLGTHPTAEIAHSVYLDAKRRLHAGCTI